MEEAKLNKLVAETVFGWTGVFIDKYGDCRGYPPGHRNLEPTGAYARYMTAAWQVVERMKKTPCAEQFVAWFNHANLWSLSENDAAHLICDTAVWMLNEKEGKYKEAQDNADKALERMIGLTSVCFLGETKGK